MGACASKSGKQYVRGASEKPPRPPSEGSGERDVQSDQAVAATAFPTAKHGSSAGKNSGAGGRAKPPEGVTLKEAAPTNPTNEGSSTHVENGAEGSSSASDSWQSSEERHEASEKGDKVVKSLKSADNDEAPPGLSHMGSSKLEESQRRRLSVSTVQTSSPAENIVGANTKGLLSFGSGGLPTTGEPRQRRSRIQKFDDPALQLVDERRGSIREVSMRMILDLIPDAHTTLACFGAPCWEVQKGFDNKDVEISGSLANTTSFADLGIGFACKKGLKPESPNQDDFFILRIDDWGMYGVFDGHGPCGHEVSNFVHTALPFLIMSDPQFEEDTPATLRRAFKKVHHLLEAAAEQADAYLDCTLSGTTGTVVVHRDNKLYIAHVGDSRAALSQRDKRSVSLTIDHKPTIEAEKARVEANGGEVRRLEGDIPYRVFVKNRMYPGLAMSRAIGDTVGAAVGVISDPDVRVVDLQKNDVYIIVATDGVWEFISTQESVDFCSRKSRKQVQEAAEFLAYESWRRWVEEEENVVDDVTCVIVYLD